MREKNKGNLVSNRSKQLMENALLKLMRSENYHEITIQEITYHAHLSRRTFYRNYSSKDEILEDCFAKIWMEYRALISQQNNLSLANIARIFFTQMQKNRDFLALVNRHQMLSLFLAKVDALLPAVFYELRGETIPFSKESIRYALAFSTGGFMRILILWLDGNCQKSPDEMAAILEDFLVICNNPNLTDK